MSGDFVIKMKVYHRYDIANVSQKCYTVAQAYNNKIFVKLCKTVCNTIKHIYRFIFLARDVWGRGRDRSNNAAT